MSQIITLTIDTDGIAELRWDDPAHKVNVFSPEAIDEFAAQVDRVVADEAIRGVLITSGKAVFHAGADLRMVADFFDMSAEDLWAIMAGIMHSFYALETCGKPVAAAINGHCLGGGFEMALAAHARFAADDPKIKIGLPEAALGLMPGFGGTQRMARLARWQEAIAGMLEGETYDVEKAVSLGLLTGVVPGADLRHIAKGWLLANTDVQQPWMVRGYRGPGGTMTFERFFYGLNARLTHDGADAQPEKKLIAEAVYHGLQMPIEPALRVEIRRFIELTRIPSVRKTMQTRFFGEDIREI